MFANKFLRLAQVSVVGLTGYYVGETFKNEEKPNKSICISPELILEKTDDNVPLFPWAAETLEYVWRYGFPSVGEFICYDDYVIAYDGRNKIGFWAFERLTKDRLKKTKKYVGRRVRYKIEENIHPFFRAQVTDYKGYKFERGQLALASNHYLSERDFYDTFYLSNIAPQVRRGFHKGMWHRLERYVRKRTEDYENIYCYTGPLFIPRKESDGKTYVVYQVIGENCVAVPTHYFKIFLGEKKDKSLHLEAYVLPNEKIPNETSLASFMVPPDTIERAAGFLFFSKLPRSALATINGEVVK